MQSKWWRPATGWHIPRPPCNSQDTGGRKTVYNRRAAMLTQSRPYKFTFLSKTTPIYIIYNKYILRKRLYVEKKWKLRLIVTLFLIIHINALCKLYRNNESHLENWARTRARPELGWQGGAMVPLILFFSFLLFLIGFIFLINLQYF